MKRTANVNNIRDKVVLESVNSSVTRVKFSDYLVSKMYTSPLEIRDLAYSISLGLKWIKPLSWHSEEGYSQSSELITLNFFSQFCQLGNLLLLIMREERSRESRNISKFCFLGKENFLLYESMRNRGFAFFLSRENYNKVGSYQNSLFIIHKRDNRRENSMFNHSSIWLQQNLYDWSLKTFKNVCVDSKNDLVFILEGETTWTSEVISRYFLIAWGRERSLIVKYFVISVTCCS